MGIRSQNNPLAAYLDVFSNTGTDAMLATGSSIIDTEDFFGDGSGKALYKFDNNLNDVSGNYNASNIAGSASYNTSTPKIGAASYESTSSSSILLDGLNQPETAPWTAMWWWRRPNSTSLSTNNRMVDFKENTSSRGTTVVWESDSSWHFCLRNNQGGTSQSKLIGSGSGLNNDAWHHIVVGASGTGSSQTAFVYVDGAQVNSDTSHQRSDSSENDGIVVGGGYGGSISGLFDNWRYFNRALTSSEITEIYDAENAA